MSLYSRHAATSGPLTTSRTGGNCVSASKRELLSYGLVDNAIMPMVTAPPTSFGMETASNVRGNAAAIAALTQPVLVPRPPCLLSQTAVALASPSAV